MTTKSKQSTASQAKSPETVFVDAFRGGMGAVKKTSLAAAEIPLSVLSSLGVSEEATGAARKSHQDLTQGITEAVDTIATQSAKVAGKGVSLFTDAFAAATKGSSS